MTPFVLAALVLLPTDAPPRASVVDTIIVHRYAATEASYDVNAWWLESDEGVVLIDALFLQSDSRLLAEQIRARGKPLVAILLTHPHVDHYGGVPGLRAAFPDVKLFSTAATAAGIQPTHDRGIAAGWLQAMAGDSGYGGAAHVDSIVPSGTTLTLGGMQFRMIDMGPGEASNNAIVHQQELDVLFTGDLTVAHAPIYVGEGRATQLRAALVSLRRQFADSLTVYAGHYAPMALGPLVEANLDQLDAATAIVANLAETPANLTSDGMFVPDARRAALDALTALYRPLARYGLSARILAAMNLPGLMADSRSAQP